MSDELTQTVGQVDFLSYVRVVRRTLAAAILSSFSLAGLRLAADFRTSEADGFGTLNVVISSYVTSVVVVVIFLVSIWVPAMIRAQVLRRQLPEASSYVVKRIPHFWSRLEAVTRVTSRAKQNSTLTVDESSVSIWCGMAHPHKIAELPLVHLLRIERDRAGVTPFRRRLIVLTFDLGGRQLDLPLALRSLGWLGYKRLGEEAESRLIGRLNAMASASAAQSADA